MSAGEIQVEFRRPEMRFGTNVFIHQQDPITGKRVLLQQGEGDDLVWVEIENNVDVKPTFFFDDQVLKALSLKWIEASEGMTSVELGVESVLLSALEDNKGVRDRLLSIIEKQNGVGS